MKYLVLSMETKPVHFIIISNLVIVPIKKDRLIDGLF